MEDGEDCGQLDYDGENDQHPSHYVPSETSEIHGKEYPDAQADKEFPQDPEDKVGEVYGLYLFEFFLEILHDTTTL